jgi:hypothetical protein
MSEWLVDIESEPAVASTPEHVERFAAALDTVRGVTGASAGLDRTTGVNSATFSLLAADAVGAADHGVATLDDALSRSGLGRADPARVSVERLAAADAVPA